MSGLYILPVFLMIAFLGYILIFRSQGKSPIQVMLMGIALILIGGILVLDNNVELAGMEYVVLLLGFLLALTGYMKVK